MGAALSYYQQPSGRSQRATFECTALRGTNKQGILTPDKDGYYNDIVLGGLNVFNSKGQFYCLAGAQELFETSSSFMRRVNSGALYGENGHPRQNGMSDRAYIRRVMDIVESEISHHIRSVYLDSQNVRDENGKIVVAIMGSVKPTGDKGLALKEAFENRHQSIAFSIRSFTEDNIVNGICYKKLREIITFDRVVEPGIGVATKWKYPSLESFSELSFTSTDLQEMVAEEKSTSLSMESGNGIGPKQLMEMFGWNQKSAGGIILPPSASYT